MKRLVMIVLGLLCVAPIATGKAIRASTVAEVSAAAKKAAPGDTVLLTNGEWKDSQLVIAAKGTKEQPVVVKAETGGRVVFTGASQMRLFGEHLVVDGMVFKGCVPPKEKSAVIEFRDGTSKVSSYTRVTNTAIINCNPSDKWTDYKWVSLYGRHNRVDHCYFTGKNHQGALLVVWLDDQPNYHRIDHNYFGYRPPHYENGAETIRIGTSDWSMYDSFTTVENNYFEDCNGEHEIISNKSCGNVYRSNTFVRSQGALTLRHGNRCVVEGNFFFGQNVDSTGGVRIIGEDHLVYNNYFNGLKGNNFYSPLTFVLGIPNGPLNGYFQVKRSLVAFNTFVDNKYNINIGVIQSRPEAVLPPEDCVIANNLIVGGTASIIERVTPVNMKYEGNIIQSEKPATSQPAGMLTANALLTLAADSLWRPHAGSAALKAATGNYPFVKDDIDGQARTGAMSVGADEISNEPRTRFPMSPKTTGPDWMRRKQ